MKSLTGVLVAHKHRWKILLGLSSVLFVVIAALMGAFAVYQVRSSLLGYSAAGLEEYASMRQNVGHALDSFQAEVTAEPCTEAYYRQLRRVAYMPDGVSEFLYAPDGAAQCSLAMGRLAEPFELGLADLQFFNGSDVKLWFDRQLDFLGLEGLAGNIVARGPLAVVVPPQAGFVVTPPWISSEAVVLGNGGRWWHQAGDSGIYNRHHEANVPWELNGDAFFNVACDARRVYCVATEASIGNLLAFGSFTVVGALALSALLAFWLAAILLRLLQSYFGFEARFRRHMSASTIICHYQPILDLRDGSVVGCEVLARWRDYDGSMVYPDRFLPIVESHGLTLELTRLVIEKAHEELSSLTMRRRLQVNFNVFPQDFDAARLIELFDVFRRQPIGVDLAVEIIETDDLDVETAQYAIESLAQAGIRTYLDDFGSGYSSIHRLAALSLEGVKLDRAFAMAPDGTLMAQMLPHALDMMQRARRLTVVEGVETQERLCALRDTGLVDFAQGYYIARPMDIERFAFCLSDGERHALPAQRALLALAPPLASAG